MTEEIKNGIIKSTFLGKEDHGIFTWFVNVEWDGGGGGFGGYAIDEYNEITKKREGHPFGIDCISSILDSVEVQTWEELIDKPVRVKIKSFSMITELGHFIKNKWCAPLEIRKKYREKND